ncbi:unnamed protein product [Polarella glacialis]|uniref:Uncharacterized protein n=1 Tax=Polarella glacialis TaxID=89957 RepID=A0A813H042_POLGL|nr:unnamed protein product [Polarella glacialis]
MVVQKITNNINSNNNSNKKSTGFSSGSSNTTVCSIHLAHCSCEDNKLIKQQLKQYNEKGIIEPSEWKVPCQRVTLRKVPCQPRRRFLDQNVARPSFRRLALLHGFGLVDCHADSLISVFFYPLPQNKAPFV